MHVRSIHMAHVMVQFLCGRELSSFAAGHLHWPRDCGSCTTASGSEREALAFFFARVSTVPPVRLVVASSCTCMTSAGTPIKCSMRLMRMAVLKSSHIRDVEIHRVSRAMLSPTDGHVCVMYLRTSVGAVLLRVARLLAIVANAGKRTNAATITATIHSVPKRDLSIE